MAKHHGLLKLQNLRINDISVASALAKHTGVLNLWSSDWSDDVLRVFVAMPEIYLQNHSYYAEKLRERESASIESGTLNSRIFNDHELLLNDEEELLLEDEPPEASPPLPENIDDYYVGYSVQIASGHTEGGSIKVSDLMHRVEQGTIPASYARDVLIRANAMLYGEVDNLKMNEKERKAMQILQKYIDQLQGK